MTCYEAWKNALSAESARPGYRVVHATVNRVVHNDFPVECSLPDDEQLSIMHNEECVIPSWL